MLFQDPGMSGRFMKQVRPQWPLNRTTKVVLDIKNALPELWARSCRTKMFVLFGVVIVYGGLTDDIHHVIIKAHPK